MSESPTLELACELIRCASVTPNDAGCQAILARRLAPLGFRIESMRFDEVDNLWARRGGDGPLLVLLGHTDVVPTGPPEDWSSPPFEPTIRDANLYGRGAADMKGSIAAMVTAIERFLARHPEHHGSVALLVTSDEEGPSVNGVRRVMETLGRRDERIDWCLVGEPSSTDRLGDTVRIGRRGSLNGTIVVRGLQGHVAYPHLARNPVHGMARLLASACRHGVGRRQRAFPSDELPGVERHRGNRGGQRHPRACRSGIQLPLLDPSRPRFAGERRWNPPADAFGLDCDIDWRLSGEPFLTRAGAG